MRYSFDLNIRFLNIVPKKGMLLTFIISTLSAISRCCSLISGGRGQETDLTCVDLVHVVFFPFKEPSFGLKISSAAMISILIIGQFVKPPWASTVSMKDARLG